MRWKRLLRYQYLRFVRLRATPANIARGFAIGIFWGMFPLPGVQMLTAILTAALLRSNKLAAAAGTWLSNPLTTIPLTLFNFEVGRRLLNRQPIEFSGNSLRSVDGWLELGSDFAVSYLFGCFVVGAISALAFYFLGLPLIASSQGRFAARRAGQRRKKLGKAWIKPQKDTSRMK